MEVNMEIFEKVNEIVSEYYDMARESYMEESIVEHICNDLDDMLYNVIYVPHLLTTIEEKIRDIVDGIEELKDKNKEEKYQYFDSILDDNAEIVSWLKKVGLYDWLIDYYRDEASDEYYEDLTYEMIDALESAFSDNDDIEIGNGSYKVAIVDKKEKSVIKFDNLKTFIYDDGNGIDWEYRVYNSYKSNGLDFLLVELLPISNLINNPATHYYLQPMVEENGEKYCRYTDKDIKRIVNKRSSKFYNATKRYFYNDHFFHALMDSYGFKTVLDYVIKLKEGKIPALEDIHCGNVSYVNNKIVVLDYGISYYY